MDSLVAANERNHEFQTACYECFLVALTGLEYSEAEQALTGFEAMLLQHMELEDEEILPRFIRIKAASARCLSQVEGDHWILLRTLEKVKNVFEEIRKADSPRYILVRSLGVLNRLKEVLDHHTLREGQYIYPLLDESLDPTDTEYLVQRLMVGIPDAGS